MSLLCPFLILLVGAGLSGGLLYSSHRMRGRLKTIEDARPCKAGSPGTGLVKLQGTAKAVNPSELLISPIDQKPCVYYRLVIEEFQQSSSNSTNALTRRGPGSGSWVPIIEDVQAIPMVIADETGAVSVDANEARLDFQQNRTHANWLTSLPKELEESLRERYKIVTKNWFLPKQMRYTEVVVAQDTEVFAVGHCEERDGKATLVKKDEPVLITFRTEERVTRNWRIEVAIYKWAGIIVPILFVGIAILAWRNMPEQPGSQPAPAKQNAPKAGGKTGKSSK